MYIKRQSLKSNKTAIIDGNKIYSYTDLSKEIESLTLLFKSLHITKQKIIGIFSENSFFYISFLLAIEKIDCVTLPINTLLSIAEILNIINQVSIDYLIVSQKYHKLIEDFKGRFVCIDKVNFSIIIFQKRNNPTAKGKKSLSMICLTSGTTGKPKGVMLTRNNIISNCRSVIQTMRITKKELIFIVKPFHYISSISELFIALLLNCTLIINSGVFLPEYIIKTMEKLKPTFFCGVPILFNLLVEYLENLDKKIRIFGKILIVGSAPSASLLRKLQSRFPLTEIYIGYGLTEASPRVSTLRINDDPELMDSVGKPIKGVKIAIYNNEKKCRPYETGEIRVKGKNVFVGYLNNTMETAKKISHRWLLTGDIGYRDNKNNLFIMGRNDDIINKGGVKIAPKEIENIIFMLDGIKDAVVLGEPCSLYNEKIRACIVKKSDTPLIDQSYIQTFLRQHISAYKIPDTIEFYEVLPRNANGKIDKQALLIKEKTI